MSLSSDGLIVSYQLEQVYVWPEIVGYQNVVGKVKWQIVFQRGSFSSIAYIETELSPGDIINFVPIDQVNRALLFSWCLSKEGGENYLALIQRYHLENIDRQERQSQLVEYSISS
jgi:hypothetical protein